MLDVGKAKPDIRDKRLRVRADGQRIVPYYTRAEIEQGAMTTAQVIVWVDNDAALYSMHVQGSGKVQLPDGQIVRLAYGEQNGHPFTPPIQKARKGRPRPATVLTRGIEIPASDAEEDSDEDVDVEDDSPADGGSAAGPLLRGGQPAPARQSHPTDPAPPGGKAGDEMSPEVARMVELLLKGTESQGPQRIRVDPAPTAEYSKRPATEPPGNVAKLPQETTSDIRPAAQSAPSVAKSPPAPANDKRPVNESASTLAKSSPATQVARPVAAEPAPLAAATPTKTIAGLERPSMFSSDPSYVFFRQIPDTDGGPLGALGVPLTPGRSVAVDPRTTPLGAPVFIATTGASPGSGVSRLMLAQDTGGAIRGAVRADYFWGFGANAGERASRMKEYGRMWLLLPKALALSAGTGGFATRGVGGSASDAECLIPDPELCVE